MVTPRQLASSVRKTGVGSTDSVASLSTIGDSSTLHSPIFFGSLGFSPHSPVTLPAFADLHAGVDVSFGELRFYVNKWGTLRLTDTPRFAGTTLATSSSAAVASASSSVESAVAVLLGTEFSGELPVVGDEAAESVDPTPVFPTDGTN